MSASRSAGIRFEDATAPDVSLTHLPTNVRATVHLSATANDYGAGVKQVDFYVQKASTTTLVGTDTTAPYEADWAIPAGYNGEMVYVKAKATDRSAFANSSSAVQIVLADSTPPDTTIDGGPDDNLVTSNRTATFTFYSPDDGNTTYQCRIYRSDEFPDPFVPCSGGASQSYADLADGTYVFEVRAVDPAGNADPTVASRTWTVAQPAPDPDPDPTPTPTPDPMPTSNPTPGPSPTPDPIPEPGPTVNDAECIVPDVRGTKLRVATRELAAAHCAVGRVSRAKHGKAKHGRVISQSVAPGSHLPANSAVALRVRR
jgi:hypothetical protein